MSSDPSADFDHDENPVEAQLRSTLRQDLSRALQSRRPLLTHLNADTTWLLSIPVPEPSPRLRSGSRKPNAKKGEGSIETGDQKTYFHILIDPWLKGSQSDVAQFFSQQWHAFESAVQTVAEIEDAIREVEKLARSTPTPTSAGGIDAVVVSHEFTDHMHKETLLEVPSTVPVFAASKAASIIRSWHHFDAVMTIPTNLTTKNTDWRTTSIPPLPPWLGMSRLGVDRIDLLYYHSAVLFTFSSTEDVEDGGEAEAVIYTPHGITMEDLKPITNSQPPIKTLALLHGLHDVSIGGQLNLGAFNGLQVQRATNSKYWVGTHDEVKRGGGLVSWFLKRKVYTVKEALEKEIREKGVDGENLDDVHFAELSNGESLLLE